MSRRLVHLTAFVSLQALRAGVPALVPVDSIVNRIHTASNAIRSYDRLSAQMSSSSLFITSCIWLDW